jgi:hypothetical protein
MDKCPYPTYTEVRFPAIGQPGRYACRSSHRRTCTDPVKTKPVIRRVTLDEVRTEVARFEAAHPGMGAENYPDAFRDDRGGLVESEEFFDVCRLYSVLAASGE